MLARILFSSGKRLRLEQAYTSTRCKVVPDYLAVFHYEPNMFQFADVGDWISGNSDHIRELAGLYRPYAILQPSISAAFTVTARPMSNGGMPASRNAVNMVAVAWPRVFPG